MQAVRIGRVILGLATLLWGFLQAPFDHIHPGEDFAHQAASAPVHLHAHDAFALNGPAATACTPAEDDEIDVLWNAAACASLALHMHAGLAERVSVPAPSIASVAIVIPRHRGHDPPEYSPKIPRAPPA